MTGRDLLRDDIGRRTFLKGAAGLAAAGVGLPLLDACGAGGGGDKNTLRVFTQTGPPIASAVAASAAEFKKKTGVTVKLITAPFGQLYTKTLADFQTGGGSYDVVLAASSWLGDLQAFVEDLTDRVKNDSSMKWDDVIYQGNAQWDGRQVAIPIDGDNHLCYYRRDILEDKGLSAEVPEGVRQAARAAGDVGRLHEHRPVLRRRQVRRPRRRRGLPPRRPGVLVLRLELRRPTSRRRTCRARCGSTRTPSSRW